MSNYRFKREEKTLECMIKIYCTHIHKHRNGICSSCSELLEYSMLRLNKCCFGAKKPVCFKCTLHCYMPDMRDRVKEVMRFSGKKMIFAHPILTVRHMIDLI